MESKNLVKTIMRRAYAIWEEEGRPEGRAEAHWHQAEREIFSVQADRRHVPSAGVLAMRWG